MTPNVKRLLILALPAAITGGITQINQLIGTAIASAQDSAVSSLAYADRIYQRRSASSASPSPSCFCPNCRGR